MKIISLHLKNFKRFTDLTIAQIPTTAQLVLLVGANGSGKSSVFDAFNLLNAQIRADKPANSASYYRKNTEDADFSASIQLDQYADEFTVNQEGLQSEATPLPKNTFYGRSSFRQLPRLTRTNVNERQSRIEQDEDRPRFFIDRDERLENDIEHIAANILRDIFRKTGDSADIHKKYLQPINDSLLRIFGDGKTSLQLTAIIPPLEGEAAKLLFRKGSSEVHYDFLSAGEKEVVNLLINLLTRTPHYQNSIYYFDEIDLHLHTGAQYRLLQDLCTHWLPEGCQLWLATHSLGFIEYARESDSACIVDFDQLDFDQPQTLLPLPKDHADLYEIAVNKAFLPSLFRQMDIFFVENKDQRYYANCQIAQTVFISDNNRNSVFHKVRATAYKGIVDRDFLSGDDILQIRQHYPKLYSLHYYSIENYLYHPENLAEYYASKEVAFDEAAYIDALRVEKDKIAEELSISILLIRGEYPYFGEPEFKDTPLSERFKNKQANREQTLAIVQALKSEAFEQFYPHLPMKTYCKQLPQRQNCPPNELSKTQWFSNQIRQILGK